MRHYRQGTLDSLPRYQRVAGSYSHREHHLWSRHRMTLEQFEAMVEAQKGRCALCGSDEPAGSKDQWHIDHDHSCCGKDRSCASCRRGLLCNRCNQELGVIEKHRFRMNEVFAYLDRKAGSTDTI